MYVLQRYKYKQMNANNPLRYTQRKKSLNVIGSEPYAWRLLHFFTTLNENIVFYPYRWASSSDVLPNCFHFKL